MKFSLIIATCDRTAEVLRLMTSLAAQSHQNFEAILIDQNSDERLADLEQRFASSFPVSRIKAPRRGHAAANNVGLKFVTGEIIAFVDDDCWYPQGLLEQLAQRFASHPEWAAITGREASSDAGFTNQRFDTEAGDVTMGNIWRRHVSFTMFFRRTELRELYFDENIGIGAGTIWGAGEETDYLIRFIQKGNRVYYDPSLVVYHPDWAMQPHTAASIKKAHSYGMGMGRLLRIFEFPAGIVLKYLLRPLGGLLLSIAKGRHLSARYYLAVFSGRVRGWFLSARESSTSRANAARANPA